MKLFQWTCCCSNTAEQSSSSLVSLLRSADANATQHSVQADAPQQAAEPEECEEEEYDPYAPLDPHAKGSLPIKPFKKGKKPSARRRPKQADLPQLCKLGVSINISPLKYHDMYGWK